MSELEEDQQTIVTSGAIKFKSRSKEDDAFSIKPEDIKKLRGLAKRHITKINRQIKNGYKGSGGAESQFISDEQLWGYQYLDCILPPYNVEYLTKLYEISPAHHAAVNAKVESVYGMGWDWIESPETKRQRDSKNTPAALKKIDTAVSVWKKNMSEWLEDVNNLDVFDEVLKKVGIDYETTGNAYIEIGRTTSGKVGYIGHIPAKHVRIRRERDGFVQIVGRDVRFFRNFGDLEMQNPITEDQEPNEIIHLKKYSPTNIYYGVPDIISAKAALGGNEFSSRYNLDYFENKAVPRYVIVVKNGSIKPENVNKLVEFFEGGLRGQHHRSLYVPLVGKSTDNGSEPEIEFKAIETGQQDFSFGDYREANNEEIFMAHRIPATRVGVFSKNVSLSASRDADKVFKESYSRPEQIIFEKKMAKIVKQMTDVVVFKLNELSLVDEDTKSKIIERNVRMGVLVPDEPRREMGLPPRPDGKGDEPWQANAQQAAEATAQAGASRTRDSARSASASNGPSGTGTRNEAGAGRSVS